jgi:hypothetical protein
MKDLTFQWRAESKDLSEKNINLVSLAQKGVSRVDLVSTDKDGREVAVPYIIDWVPSLNQAKLRRWLEPDVVSCDAQAHEEKVDLGALNGDLNI